MVGDSAPCFDILRDSFTNGFPRVTDPSFLFLPGRDVLTGLVADFPGGLTVCLVRDLPIGFLHVP